MSLDLATLWAFVLLALTGAPHCAGMCGGLAVAAEAGRSRPWIDRAAFLVGKAATYALLGLGVSLGLARVVPQADLERARGVLAWLAGVALVLGGLVALGVVRARGRAAPAWLGPLSRGLGAARRSVSGLPGAAAPLAGGLLTGLLPCGLSWSGFVLAASTTPLTAAVGLVAFGLATGPALVGVALASRGVSGVLRSRARLVGGVALVLLGTYTAWRGGVPGLPEGASASTPPCCAAPDAP